MQGGSIECFELLLSAGAVLSSASPTSEGTLLHLAATNGHVAMLVHLLGLEALEGQVNVRDKYGATAIFLAVESGSIECFRELLKAGADPAIMNDTNWTPLHAAAWLGASTLVEDLLETGLFDLNIQDRSGRTASVIAADEESNAFLELLLSAGADPSIRDNLGRGVLHAAAQVCSCPMLKTLFKARGPGDINAKAESDLTPLMHALRPSSRPRPSPPLATIQFLLEHGAALHFRNKYGESALDLACQDGSSEVVELLKGCRFRKIALESVLASRWSRWLSLFVGGCSARILPRQPRCAHEARSHTELAI
eukprot:m.702758 g.702758  ORF g.702758 m.702758 type:complete len:310 (+) comp58712_c0_seq76:860-1789(+)